LILLTDVLDDYSDSMIQVCHHWGRSESSNSSKFVVLA
jgi:hypothetical protein